MANRGTMLYRLEVERIFSVNKVGDKFEFAEECEAFYSEFFTRDELLELIEELKWLAGSD